MSRTIQAKVEIRAAGEGIPRRLPSSAAVKRMLERFFSKMRRVAYV